MVIFHSYVKLPEGNCGMVFQGAPIFHLYPGISLELSASSQTSIARLDSLSHILASPIRLEFLVPPKLGYLTYILVYLSLENPLTFHGSFYLQQPSKR
jgi:hypothetical protein